MLTDDPVEMMDVDDENPTEEMVDVDAEDNEAIESQPGLPIESSQPGLPDLICTGTTGTFTSDSLSTPQASPQDTSPINTENLGWQPIAGPKSSSGSEMSLDFDSDDDLDLEPEVASFTAPFDLGLLKRSIEIGGATLDQVTGKDVVLVVGKTGTGKSTFIQAVAGKRLKSVDHAILLGKNTDFHTVFEAEDPLDGFEIGHSKLSATKSINSYEHTTGKGTKLLFIDTPGYEDTDGHEVDIATSIMLSEVAKRCKSLRFVVLINFVSLLEDRGGSVAAVLRFIRSFVKDFESDKKSFMFLFSHSNEMKDVSSLDGAATKVYREIVQMLAVKQDANVYAVLKFMKQSFDRKYLFVNVFDPILTDMGHLLKFVESQLKPVRGQTLSLNCGLTMASKLKLNGEIQKLSLELQRQLSSSEVDTSKITEISETLLYLEHRIAVKDVKEAASKCKTAIQRFCAEKKEFIDVQISRASDCEHEFGDQDRKRLLKAIREYNYLSCDAFLIDRVLSPVTKLTEYESLDSLDSGRRFALKLKKLYVWVDVSPKFRELYKQTVKYAQDIIEEITSCLVSYSKHEISFSSLDEEDTRQITSHFAVVDAIVPFTDALAEHALPVHDAIQASADLQSAIILELSSWEDDLRGFEGRSCTSDDLQKLLARGVKLQTLRSHIKSHSERLKHTVGSVMQSLETQVVGYFEKVSCGEDLSRRYLCENDVNHLRVLNETSIGFARLTGTHWKQAITHMKRILQFLSTRTMQIEKEIRCQIKAITQSGFSNDNGSRCASLFIEFNRYRFLDELLGETDAFVKNVLMALSQSVVEIMGKVETDVETMLSKLAEAQTETTKTGHVLENLIGILPEVEAITGFSNRIGDEYFSQFSDKVEKKLQAYLEEIKELAEKTLHEWISLTQYGDNLRAIEESTEALDDLLGLLDRIGTSGASIEIRNAAKTMKQTTTSHLVQFSAYTDDCFNDETPDFDKLATQLSCVQAFGCFPCTSKHLPEFNDLKSRATRLVSAAAEAVEHKVEVSACWDAIDGLLLRLQAAQVLDIYTSNQASSRLGPLQKLLMKKDEDVDATVEKMIQDKDFYGVGDLIIPLAESTDQLKRRKFDRYRETICDQLQNLVHKLQLSLDSLTCDTASVILEWLKTLASADSELGQYLRPKIKLDLVIGSCKRKLNAVLRSRTDRFLKVVKSFNFVEMAISSYDTVNLAEQFKAFLSKKTKSSVQEMVEKFKLKKDEIPEQIEKFISHRFSQESHLQQVLVGLQKASEHEHAAMAELSRIYDSTKTEVTDRLVHHLTTLGSEVDRALCYGGGVAALASLLHELDNGLSNHIDVTKLPFECKDKLKLWREKAHDERGFLLSSATGDQGISELCKKLNKLQRARRIFFGWLNNDYDATCSNLTRESEAEYNKGSNALQSRDFVQIKESMDKLHLWSSSKLFDHVPATRQLCEQLSTEAQTSFVSLLETSKQYLCGKQTDQFKGLFADIKGFALNLPSSFNLDKVQSLFIEVNHHVFDILTSQIASLKVLFSLDTDNIDFHEIRSQVDLVRDFGGFVADQYTLFMEEVKQCGHKVPKKWIDDISSLCHADFSEGRNLPRLKLYAVLGIVPSASQAEIRRAYKSKARIYHPDKSSMETTEAEILFRQIKEAHDILLSEWSLCSTKPFDKLIIRIGQSLIEKVNTLLREERYGIVESLLFKIPALTELQNLVNPKLDCKGIQLSIELLVASHVKAARTSVETLWSERKYRELNESIEDLQTMERHFKSFQKIFPDSWNGKVFSSIEHEIKKLGRDAKDLLSTPEKAEANKTEFRQCILHMGCVLVDLPQFQGFTKSAMSDVLECSLENDWGFAFLFELGLSLRRSEDDSEDEARVAYYILAEFSHFKEIETMCWNTETTQKPAEDTVLRIKAHNLSSQSQTIPIDQNRLLESFSIFESEYKALLGDYLRPESDREELAQRTIALCNQAKPVSCEGGWSDNAKAILPRVLAGVFALFTVSKSGDSFQRVENSGQAAKLGDQVLMKPHNIQVLTLLYMFGCDSPGFDSLESQLLRIRTGEGKSIILGAAASVLALFGFKVRCVCYSEYLSCRDFALFEDVFDQFGLRESITYSKITTLSEDTTAAKGDIRLLTECLLRDNISRDASGWSDDLQVDYPKRLSRDHRNSQRARKTKSDAIPIRSPTKSLTQGLERLSTENVCEEILLLDEVDVFFGSDFYGQTYNQVAQVYEPEIRQIMELIWKNHKDLAGRRQSLSAVTCTDPYRLLLKKFPNFQSIIDNEISLMLDQVRRVSDEDYYLSGDGRIGYKDMDTINYNVTFGYRTSFAYLQEYDAGRLGVDDLSKALCMTISCGQFSYANIRPTRIMGVSGTLEAMGGFEKNVLLQYGIKKFIFMPSVYGKSNFDFQKADGGLFIESSCSDYFLKLCSEINKAVKKKRAVIVFFRDTASLREFESSSFYRQLGRQKSQLVEDMAPEQKDFVIKKAATAGQITICSAAFGRGTDFFCKDKRVQENGGVHVIQAFLSTELSEEIQIQGRTARQGKEGTYQMILLDNDLERDFDLAAEDRDQIPKSQWYKWLSSARCRKYEEFCVTLADNLKEAVQRDSRTHKYFDALLSADEAQARTMLEEIYFTMKKPPMPSKISIELAFVVDVTGSMCPFIEIVRKTISSLIEGRTSVGAKLRSKFPEVEFEIRTAMLGFRDIDDGGSQFSESLSNNGHFIDENTNSVGLFQNIMQNPSGGHDLAEDILGAVHRCASWTDPVDWSRDIKFIMLFTDAPAHGMVPSCSANVVNADKYATLHPDGLTTDKVAAALVARDIDLFFCSFNPGATEKTEASLGKSYLEHKDNVEKQEITVIPMVNHSPQRGQSALMPNQSQHIVFVLDESGSMGDSWSGVVAAYNKFLACRMQNQNMSDLASVVQFDGSARTSFQHVSIMNAPTVLGYRGGGTSFSPAASMAHQIVLATPAAYDAVVVFMSDGLADECDAQNCATIFADLNTKYHGQRGIDLQLHVIAFGAGLDQRQLQHISNSTPKGKIHTTVGSAQLSDVFVDIANSSQDVGALLEKEIGKRISDAVETKLVLEYLR